MISRTAVLILWKRGITRAQSIFTINKALVYAVQRKIIIVLASFIDHKNVVVCVLHTPPAARPMIDGTAPERKQNPGEIGGAIAPARARLPARWNDQSALSHVFAYNKIYYIIIIIIIRTPDIDSSRWYNSHEFFPHATRMLRTRYTLVVIKKRQKIKMRSDTGACYTIVRIPDRNPGLVLFRHA